MASIFRRGLLIPCCIKILALLCPRFALERDSDFTDKDPYHQAKNHEPNAKTE
jgi:hypothetical protein